VRVCLGAGGCSCSTVAALLRACGGEVTYLGAAGGVPLAGGWSDIVVVLLSGLGGGICEVIHGAIGLEAAVALLAADGGACSRGVDAAAAGGVTRLVCSGAIVVGGLVGTLSFACATVVFSLLLAGGGGDGARGGGGCWRLGRSRSWRAPKDEDSSGGCFSGVLVDFFDLAAAAGEGGGGGGWAGGDGGLRAGASSSSSAARTSADVAVVGGVGTLDDAGGGGGAGLFRGASSSSSSKSKLSALAFLAGCLVDEVVCFGNDDGVFFDDDEGVCFDDDEGVCFDDDEGVCFCFARVDFGAAFSLTLLGFLCCWFTAISYKISLSKLRVLHGKFSPWWCLGAAIRAG